MHFFFLFLKNLFAPDWENPGDLGIEPQQGRSWGREGCQQGMVPCNPSSKAAVFFRGNDLCTLEITCTSGTSQAPLGGMAKRRNSQG